MDDAGNILATFAAGGASFNNAYIVDLDADNISVKSLDADEVLIDGTLITDLIATNAVTVVGSEVTTGPVNITNTSPSLPTSWVDMQIST